MRVSDRVCDQLSSPFARLFSNHVVIALHFPTPPHRPRPHGLLLGQRAISPRLESDR